MTFEHAYIAAIGVVVVSIWALLMSREIWAWLAQYVGAPIVAFLGWLRDRKVRQVARKWGIMLLLILIPAGFAILTMTLTDPNQTQGPCSIAAQSQRLADITYETGTIPVAYTERGCQR